MLYKFCVFIVLLNGLLAYAGDDSYKMRVSWVLSLKELATQIEQSSDHQVVQHNNFLNRFSIINEAWADSRYDCFFAGWPSSLKKSGGKKLCQLPNFSNSNYQRGLCKVGELQCQPLLFGKNLCVPFSSRKEKNSAFNNCEKKFQEEKRNNYDFLKNISHKEANELRELSLLASDICNDTTSPQRGTTVCQEINDKLPDAMKAIDQGFVGAIAETKSVQEEEIEFTPILTGTSPAPLEEECDEEKPGAHHELARQMEQIAQVAQGPLDVAYEKIKTEFLSSPFCDPEKVLNNSEQKPSAAYMSILIEDLRRLEYLNNDQQKIQVLQDLGSKYAFNSSTLSEVDGILKQMPVYPQEPDRRKALGAKARGILLQDAIKNYQSGNQNLRSEIEGVLGKSNIFKKNSQGQLECPFVSKEAFMMAMAGREKVLAQHGGSLPKKNQITIVDYTRPSNERRMFVIDLEKNLVLHNTWTANGVGNDDGKGEDGIGGSPQMSNAPGSLRSSDGFIIATSASHGSRFGNNVLLKGIDSNNSNMAARAVIVHGWPSPMGAYAEGVNEFDRKTGRFKTPLDPVARLMSTNFRSGTYEAMDDALWDLRGALSTSSYLPPTEGCLGVPTINMKHLDRKGRNKNQVELLREDLPGSLIFSYSGPEMKSKYL